MSSFGFLLSEDIFPLLSFLFLYFFPLALNGYKILGLQLFSFSILRSCPVASGFYSFHWKVTCKYHCFSFADSISFLWLLLMFSLPLIFSNLTMVFLALVFFVFILLGFCWASWVYGLIFSSHLGNCPLLFPLNIVSVLFCLSSWDPNFTQIRPLDHVPHVS